MKQHNFLSIYELIGILIVSLNLVLVIYVVLVITNASGNMLCIYICIDFLFISQVNFFF